MGFLGLSIIKSKTLRKYKSDALNLKSEKEYVHKLSSLVNDLRSERDSLLKEVKLKDQELIDLGKDMSEMQDVAAEKTNAIKKLSDTLKKKYNELDELRVTVLEYNKEEDQLRDNIKELEEKIYKQNAAKGGYVKKIKDLSAENASLKEVIESRNMIKQGDGCCKNGSETECCQNKPENECCKNNHGVECGHKIQEPDKETGSSYDGNNIPEDDLEIIFNEIKKDETESEYQIKAEVEVEGIADPVPTAVIEPGSNTDSYEVKEDAKPENNKIKNKKLFFKPKKR